MRRKSPIAAVIGAAFVLLIFPGCGPRIDLVADGQPVAKIVVPYYRSGEPDPCLAVPRDYQSVCRAAVELQDEIRQMTAVGGEPGAVLPIEDDDEADPVPMDVEIHLGDTGCTAQMADKLPFDQLSDEEAFFIKPYVVLGGKGCTPGQKIFISGPRFEDIVFYRNHGYGARYGVYEFLERELDVHWYLPGPLGKAAPTQLEDVSVSTETVVRAPSYKSRECSGFSEEDDLWALRNKMHTGGRKRWQFYHNLNLLIQAQAGSDAWRYYPDLWVYPTLPNGEPDPAAEPYIDPATADPPANPHWQPRLDIDLYDTYELAAARLHWYTANNTFEGYSIGIMDSRDWQAPQDLPKHVYQYAESERDANGIAYDGINRTIWRFLTRAVERWLELGDHENQWITTMAYNNCHSPPDATVDLPRNLIVLVSGDRTTTWLDESPGGTREFDRAHMIAWARKVAAGGKMAIAEKYWGSEMFVPRYAPSLVAESIRWSYADLPGEAGRPGEMLVEGFRAESWPIWPFDGPKFWAAARALWSAGEDGFEFSMTPFYQGLFGEAAESMTAYFDLLEAAWTGFPTDFPELYTHHTTRGKRFDRGDHFEWVDYPASIINYRDEPEILQIFRACIDPMQQHLEQARAVFEGRDPKPLEYYRVLVFQRGADLLTAMARFQEISDAVKQMPLPTNFDEAEAVLDAFVVLDGYWSDADGAYVTMCHPPTDQLPPGVDDDLLGVPRWGESYYEAHFKDFLPVYAIKQRAGAAISWFSENGYPQQQQDLEAIYDRIWDWRNYGRFTGLTLKER